MNAPVSDKDVTKQDWQAWHAAYDIPGSRLERRLRAVQERIRCVLDAAPPGPLRAIAPCAGEGRDLLEVLQTHPRRHDVAARLVEIDPRSAARAVQAAAGLPQVEIVVGDAAVTDAYRGVVPADLVLVCGVFGNLSPADIQRTIACCPQLCATGGTVVWTRHRRAPDTLPQVCRWFEDAGFVAEWVSPPEAGFGVGAHRYAGTPRPLAPALRMFTFPGSAWGGA